jgi:undecaprenyl pyrophosphate synthase
MILTSYNYCDINIIMPKDDIKFVLRVPVKQYGEASRVAKVEGKSLNRWFLGRIFGEDSLLKLPGEVVMVRRRDTNSIPVTQHDTKNCRVYRCGVCAGMGGKDEKRGLK